MLTKKYCNQFINLYLICFLVNYAWLFFNGLTFTAFNPVFFTNKLDLITDFLLLTNLQQLVISSKAFKVVLDVVFLLLPFVLLYTNYYAIKARPAVALASASFNLLYCLLLSIFSFSTTGQFIPWVIVPLVFYCTSDEKFTALFNALRWVFLAIFLSAGLWKLATGALFNAEEMSAVLMHQHTQILVDGNTNFFTPALLYLIKHKNIAQFFYIIAFVAETLFVIGFFTKKYDKYLAIAFCLFLVFDFMLMFIYYFSWFIFIGFLYFSKFEKNEKSSTNFI